MGSWMGKSFRWSLQMLLLTLSRHYFYQLSGEYATVSTPRGGWFNKPRQALNDEVVTGRGYFPSQSKPNGVNLKRNRRQLILTQSTIMDADSAKVNLISQPATCIR